MSGRYLFLQWFQQGGVFPGNGENMGRCVMLLKLIGLGCNLVELGTLTGVRFGDMRVFAGASHEICWR